MHLIALSSFWGVLYRDIEVAAPNEAEIRILEDDIRKRTSDVLADMQHSPPCARPNQEVCSYCSVRHLCDEYWMPSVQERRECLQKERRFTDMQLIISARHGPASWDGIVEYSPDIKAGNEILLRVANVPFEIHPGQTLRILNTILCAGDDDENKTSLVATSGISTEVYFLPKYTTGK